MKEDKKLTTDDLDKIVGGATTSNTIHCKGCNTDFDFGTAQSKPIKTRSMCVYAYLCPNCKQYVDEDGNIISLRRVIQN